MSIIFKVSSPLLCKLIITEIEEHEAFFSFNIKQHTQAVSACGCFLSSSCFGSLNLTAVMFTEVCSGYLWGSLKVDY